MIEFFFNVLIGSFIREFFSFPLIFARWCLITKIVYVSYNAMSFEHFNLDAGMKIWYF